METSTSERFYINLVSLVDYISKETPEDREEYIFIKIGLITLKKWDYDKKKHIIVEFIDSTHQYWDNYTSFLKKEKEKEKKTFIDIINKLFILLGKYSNSFIDIISDKDIFSNKKKDIILKFIQSFIKQSIKYIHEMRKPVHILKNRIYQPSYKKLYKQEINIEELAKRWKIILDWKP